MHGQNCPTSLMYAYMHAYLAEAIARPYCMYPCRTPHFLLVQPVHISCKIVLQNTEMVVLGFKACNHTVLRLDTETQLICWDVLGWQEQAQ